MASDAGSVSGQLDNIQTLLAEYFSNMRKFVIDTGGTVAPPDVKEMIDAMDYSELYRMVNTRFSDSASFENGAAIETIHTVAAVDREYTLRGKGKLDYYSDAESDYLSESNYYATMKVFLVNMLNGHYVEGRTS